MVNQRVLKPLPPPELLNQLLNYEPSSGHLFWVKSGKLAGYEVIKKRKVYLKIHMKGSSYYLHRVAWAIHYGEWPAGEIDHINGDSCDNSISNLRVVTRKENCQNTRLQHRSVSGYCGVNWHSQSQKWRARVKVDGKEHYIGLFDDAEEAARQIRKLRRKLGFHENHGVKLED